MKRSEIKKRPLSDTVLENLEPEEKEYKEFDSNGLYFRVRPSGAKSWYLRYKDPITGKWKPFKFIGSYPAMSGKLARETAKQELEQIANGEDISKSKSKQSYALVDLVNEWLAHRKDHIHENTSKKDKGKLYKYVIPAFGNRDYRSITPHEWLEHFQERQRTTGYFDTVNRVCGLCLQVYTYAKLIKKTIDHNPIDDVHRYLIKPESQSYPHVQQHEIGQLLRDIQHYQTEQGRYALMLLAIFHCRPSELIKAKWVELDLDKLVWSVPAERTKTNKDVLRPIPQQAKELFLKLKIIHGDSEYLFPNGRDREKPATLEFVEKALHRLGYRGRHSPHGFRHMASTYMNEHTRADGSKFDERVIEFALSHTIHGVKGKYNKAEYLDDRRELAQWYADELDKIANDDF